MAFQFKRDRGDNITLTLAGDIDLEVTPEIKTQLVSQIEDAATLTIDAANISYLDSSGVSILVIAMQSCKQKQITFSISNMSDEAMRVLQLAKLDKILPVKAVSGPAQLVDVDVFSKTGEADSALASQLVSGGADEPTPSAASGDDDLIAALASGDMAGGDMAGSDMTTDSATETNADNQEENAASEAADSAMAEPTVEAPVEAAVEPTPEPAPKAAPEPEAPSAAPTTPSSGSDEQGGGGGGFTPGTFG
jgi:anti-sigma B factor antagonist